MSAKKLGRLAGFVLALAALIGGVSAPHSAGTKSATSLQLLAIDWD